jgi:hypothetical protein
MHGSLACCNRGNGTPPHPPYFYHCTARGTYFSQVNGVLQYFLWPCLPNGYTNTPYNMEIETHTQPYNMPAWYKILGREMEEPVKKFKRSLYR